VYLQIRGFGEYGFPESHAASFALIAYASAYVKCHEPAIFLAAILNVQPMGFYSTEVLVNDARRHGVTVKPVEVNASRWWSFVDADGAVRLGFHIVRGLAEGQQQALEHAIRDGEFADVVEFARRTKLSREALENLAASGAFAPWFASRREAIWALRGLDEREARGELGRGMEIVEPKPQLRALEPLETTRLDVYALGVTTGPQPIAHFRAELERKNVLAAERLATMPNNLICKVGGMVIVRQRPGTANGFVFLTLEDETGLVNIIVRPDVFERYKRTIKLSQALIVEGKLQKESGCIDVIARRFWPLDTAGATDTLKARSFR
ncbi:MAG: OB-fold nucleic acid binding domain-containing protein, partial [Polyangiaceae bacterium]